MSFRILFLTAALLLLAACSRPGATPAPATPAPTFAPVPTFTPTPAAADQAPAAAVTPAVPSPVVPTPADDASQAAPASGDALAILVPTPTPDAPEAVPDAALVVRGEAVNVRGGPGIDYPIVGAASAGETYVPTGRNAAGDWWQVCCFDDAPGWLFATLVDVQGEIQVGVIADIPPAPTTTPAPAPVTESPADTQAEPLEEDVASEEAADEEAAAAPEGNADALQHSGTAGSFDPAAQYHIVGYRIIGYGENNGGIFNNGGQHLIFINVIDAAGNGIDGAVVKNAIADNVNIVTGAKGPGRAEFEMFWDPYKLYVASDPSGPVTSQITNQMNTAYPHIPDIIGRLGPPEEEYAICPTPDDRCEPPFFHAHWSYEVTFQKVK